MRQRHLSARGRLTIYRGIKLLCNELKCCYFPFTIEPIGVKSFCSAQITLKLIFEFKKFFPAPVAHGADIVLLQRQKNGIKRARSILSHNFIFRAPFPRPFN